VTAITPPMPFAPGNQSLAVELAFFNHRATLRSGH
jgi:hypothetical protein